MRTDHSRIWLMALLVGIGLSWPLPLGGILLAVIASFGLVISWESGMSRGVLTPAPVDPTVPAPPIDRLERHPRNAFPTQAVYDPTPGSTLRLITCGGPSTEGRGTAAATSSPSPTSNAEPDRLTP